MEGGTGSWRREAREWATCLCYAALMDKNTTAGTGANRGAATIVAEFRRSLSDAAPPPNAELAVQALWWAGKGEWDRAHECVQQREGEPRCDLVHAHLHRVEGDLSNAGYWYRRAREPAATMSTDEEWVALVTRFLS